MYLRFVVLKYAFSFTQYQNSANSVSVKFYIDHSASSNHNRMELNLFQLIRHKKQRSNTIIACIYSRTTCSVIGIIKSINIWRPTINLLVNSMCSQSESKKVKHKTKEKKMKINRRTLHKQEERWIETKSVCISSKIALNPLLWTTSTFCMQITKRICTTSTEN